MIRERPSAGKQLEAFGLLLLDEVVQADGLLLRVDSCP
jgi:predicted metalloprotease